MRRIQIYMDDVLDDRLDVESARRGVSKASLIRDAVAHRLGTEPVGPGAPWQALIGWLDNEPVDDIDEVIYGGHG